MPTLEAKINKDSMRIAEVIAELEKLAPRGWQESYDNSGLIVGQADTEVTACMICLDSTEAVIKEAKAKGCNLVIAHHPIVFGGLKHLNGKNHIERAVILAIKEDIALYAIHTNLDNVRGGVNEEIANRIGLKADGRRILIPKSGRLQKLEFYAPSENLSDILNALWKAGAGQIGRYDQCSYRLEGRGTYRPLDGSQPFDGQVGQQSDNAESKVEVILPDVSCRAALNALWSTHPYESVAYQLVKLENSHPDIGSGLVGELEKPMRSMDFLLSLKERMGAGCLKHTAVVHEKIERVAVLGGSGIFGLSAAKASGAQIYITSDVKYHEFFGAEDEIILVDIGHFESEQFTQHLIQRILAEKFPNFATLLTGVKTNPVNYL